MKRIFLSRSVFALVFALVFVFGGSARAEMPQTDVALVQHLQDAPASKKLEALALYYELHESELIVQNMNEQRTGAMFARKTAVETGSNAAQLAAVELKSQKIIAERAVRLDENQALRTKLSALSALDFDDSLVMTPDAPLQAMAVPQGTPADLVQAERAAWQDLEAAQAAWQDERLTLLDAQQRYDDTRDVALGDHMRAMTVAEAASTKAIGAYRLIAAKIAAATGQDLAQVLAAL